MDDIFNTPQGMALLNELQNRAMEQEVGIYNKLGPEGLRQQTNLGTVDERGALANQQQQAQMMALAQQLQQAQQFGEPQGKDYGSVAGNIVGGLGDAVRMGAGMYVSGKIRGRQEDLMKQGTATQEALLGQKDQARFDHSSARYQALKDLQAARMSQGRPQMGPMPQPQAPMSGEEMALSRLPPPMPEAAPAQIPGMAVPGMPPRRQRPQVAGIPPAPGMPPWVIDQLPPWAQGG